MTRKALTLFVLSWALRASASPIDVEDEVMILWPDGLTQINADAPEPTATELEIDFVTAPGQPAATETVLAKNKPDLVQLGDGVDLNMTQINDNPKLKNELEQVVELAATGNPQQPVATGAVESPTSAEESSSDPFKSGKEIESLVINKPGSKGPFGSDEGKADKDTAPSHPDSISEVSVGLNTPRKPVPLPEAEESSTLASKSSSGSSYGGSVFSKVGSESTGGSGIHGNSLGHSSSEASESLSSPSDSTKSGLLSALSKYSSTGGLYGFRGSGSSSSNAESLRGD